MHQFLIHRNTGDGWEGCDTRIIQEQGFGIGIAKNFSQGRLKLGR